MVVGNVRKLNGLLRKVRLINISIRSKLLLIYLLCVLVPTIVFSYAFYESSIRSTKNEKLNTYKQAVNRICNDIESNALNALELSNIIYPDEMMYEHINRTYYSKKSCFEDYNNYLRNAWSGILTSNTRIALFTVYTENDTLLNGNHLNRLDESAKNSDWYKKYVEAEQKNIFISHVDKLTTNTAELTTISYFRKLDYLKSRYKHLLKVTFQPDLLIRILRSEPLPGKLYVVDNNDLIVERTDTRVFAEGDREFPPFSSIRPDPEQIVLTSPLKYMNGWRVVCLLDKDFMREEYRINWAQMSVLVFSITIFASIVIYAISSSLYKRIAMLVEHMGKVSKEEYILIPEDAKGNDEIGLLITSMNRMITKISTLIEDVYKAQLRQTQLELLQKQSELNALQCQVNPHFMFNVFETIRIKSYLRNEFETARIIKYMSKIFRKLLLWNNDLIELQEEIGFIKEYMEIQQYRYEEELDFEITVDHDLMQLKIPKMTLQTFVDNACEHGFSESQYLKKVIVSAHRVNESLIEIKIYDNGKGMTPEQIENINDIECKGIGIRNVIGRLNLYYGGGYKFFINSNPGEFTEIVLTLDMDVLRRSDYV